MMKAFRPWETLFLLVTSSAGWTREALAIVTTTTCPNQRVSCPGYGDDSANKYCCPSSIQQGGFYCCNYWEKEMSNNDYSENIPEIIGGVVGATCLLASIVVLSCFFCQCCYIYKYRHRKRNASEPVARRPSSTLGWRYRNWPRSNFVPSMSASFNGASSSSTNRYYYSNRPLRESASANTYHYHPSQYHPHSHACPSPRNRHEISHPRLQTEHSASRENFPHRETDGLGYGGRSAYTPYLYQPIHTILSEAKPFEAPPPYPIAQYYPTCPPITVSEHQISRPVPTAISPVSTSTSAATSTTVIHDELFRNSLTMDSDLGGVVNTNPTGDTVGHDGFVTYNDITPKPS